MVFAFDDSRKSMGMRIPALGEKNDFDDDPTNPFFIDTYDPLSTPGSLSSSAPHLSHSDPESQDDRMDGQILYDFFFF